MFEPELFGIAASRYADFGLSLLTPLLGFLFLYLLRLPLKKLPIIGGDVNYTPPKWVLPLFANGTLFAAGLSLSIAYSLTQTRVEPDQTDFGLNFEEHIQYKPDIGPITGIEYSLDDYDGLSDFRLFLNGYRLFGTSSHCMLNFQCRHADDLGAKARFALAKPEDLADLSFRHVRELRPLPVSDDVSDYLVPGRNTIDVFVGNSGVGDCSVLATLHFRGKNAVRSLKLIVSDDPASQRIQQSTASDYDAYTFASSQDPTAPDQLIKYSTYADNPSYRICERIRVTFDAPEKLDIDRNIWKAKQASRLLAEQCAINPRQEGC
ncbi:hypothetical protein PZB21_25840 [Rhizobium sp. CBK13]|uniref:hypothetical protein n=1 Tax=Rhizobium sp. CBK13 TaxID=3031399 RepID=UPI0023AE7187|nr:hypothetical protein [Rhizobium sp. CBK13]MDE8762598.1 hypothetical protein [Rhizobium sp. CBK13]